MPVPVQQFLEGIKEALRIGSAVDTMTILKMKSSKQTALHSYCHSLASHTPHGLQDLATVIGIIITSLVL